VTFRYMYFGDGGQAAENGMKIVGMRSEHSVFDGDDGLLYATSYLGDLFDENPPLSALQMEAEKELLATASMAFWLQEARENGFTDPTALAAENLAARRDLAAIFGELAPNR
jgi:hypothetical protein